MLQCYEQHTYDISWEIYCENELQSKDHNPFYKPQLNSVNTGVFSCLYTDLLPLPLLENSMPLYLFFPLHSFLLTLAILSRPLMSSIIVLVAGKHIPIAEFQLAAASASVPLQKWRPGNDHRGQPVNGQPLPAARACCTQVWFPYTCACVYIYYMCVHEYTCLCIPTALTVLTCSFSSDMAVSALELLQMSPVIMGGALSSSQKPASPLPDTTAGSEQVTYTLLCGKNARTNM